MYLISKYSLFIAFWTIYPRLTTQYSILFCMFLTFFLLLRQNHLPVSPTEYLTLLGALQKDVIDQSTEDFYFLSRSILVKNEQHLDIFDRVFGEDFKGMEQINVQEAFAELPDDWFERAMKNELSDEERARIEKEGGLEKLIEKFKVGNE